MPTGYGGGNYPDAGYGGNKYPDNGGYGGGKYPSNGYDKASFQIKYFDLILLIYFNQQPSVVTRHSACVSNVEVELIISDIIFIITCIKKFWQPFQRVFNL